MMETAKIRKAGFAIRHSYQDFVTRYRFLVKGITNRTNARTAAQKICSEALKSIPTFALGKTKIFLKEQHDELLEKTRSEIYLRSIAIIQRGFRRIIFKRFIKRHREAAVVLQKHFRARGYRERFLEMQRGFYRLQAALHARKQRDKFQDIRKAMIGLQARCRGFLARKDLSGKITEKSRKMIEFAQLRVKEEQQLKKLGDPQWKEKSEQQFLNRLTNLNQELKIEKEKETNRPHVNDPDAQDMVDDVFKFLSELAQTTPKMKPKVARTSPSFKVSKLISYLEDKSRSVKHIPSKLLSRPVNQYDSTKL